MNKKYAVTKCEYATETFTVVIFSKNEQTLLKHLVDIIPPFKRVNYKLSKYDKRPLDTGGRIVATHNKVPIQSIDVTHMLTTYFRGGHIRFPHDEYFVAYHEDANAYLIFTNEQYHDDNLDSLLLPIPDTSKCLVVTKSKGPIELEAHATEDTTGAEGQVNRFFTSCCDYIREGKTPQTDFTRLKDILYSYKYTALQFENEEVFLGTDGGLKLFCVEFEKPCKVSYFADSGKISKYKCEFVRGLFNLPNTEQELVLPKWILDRM